MLMIEFTIENPVPGMNDWRAGEWSIRGNKMPDGSPNFCVGRVGEELVSGLQSLAEALWFVHLRMPGARVTRRCQSGHIENAQMIGRTLSIDTRDRILALAIQAAAKPHARAARPTTRGAY